MASPDYPTLEALWCEDDLDGLICCNCSAAIMPEAIIRTFRLHRPDDNNGQQPSRAIRLLGETILLYDRHLRCLDGVCYVAVSHVWNSELATANYEGRDAPTPASIQSMAYDLPIKIYNSISEDLDEGCEMWHDYISVPQWIDKQRILLAIPQIFHDAEYTLVQLDDVPPSSVQQLRGKSPEDRMRRVTSICNGRWFRRMWTAMEFIRSSRVRVLLQDYRVAKGVDDLFLGEMHAVWNQEVERLGSVQQVEQGLAHVNRNLVPWRLGPLDDVRTLRTTVFAHAFTLLSPRQCYRTHDFFYGLIGLLPLDLEETELDEDDDKACMQIARRCLELGDYNPLLMAPRRLLDHWFHAYHDVSPWGLGSQRSPPSLSDGLLVLPQGIRLRGEMIGNVTFARRAPLLDLPSREDTLAALIHATFDVSGPGLEAFVSTVGSRLCGQDTEEILERLSHQGRGERLRDLLLELYNGEERMGGWQGWRGKKDEMRFIADSMGLSSTALLKGAKFKGESPMGFVRARGYGIHGGGFAGVILSAICPVCHKSFLYRAALKTPPSEALGATAYRIPGLSYELTLKDGVGIIVKDGCIIGRMIWACPACPCRPVGEVELQFPDLLMPIPNKFEYGGR